MDFDVFIPVLPPGINATYKTTKQGGFYKSKAAKEWQAKAALIIGSQAAELDWKHESSHYSIEIFLYEWHGDVDACVKLVIDTVSQKLGFDDKLIVKQCSEKIENKYQSKGIYVYLWSKNGN